MPGLPRLRSAHDPAPGTLAEAEKAAYDASLGDCEAAIEKMHDSDKFRKLMDSDAYATEQTPTGIWGAKAAGEKQVYFSRWYYRGLDNAIIDLFLTQELYDEADVEARRAMAHRYGTRYAALGPHHSREPLRVPGTSDEAKAEQARLRKAYPSAWEQLAQGPGRES